MLNVSPAGNGLSIAYDKVRYPPLAVTGVNAVMVVFLINVLSATNNVELRAGNASTVKLKVLLLTCVGLLESVTDTVYVALALDSVAVPDTSPVEVLKLRPAGNAGLIENVKGIMPPLAVTGVNAVNAIVLIKVLLATACTVINAGGSISKLKVLLLVAFELSLTVITKLFCAKDTLGVPEIKPVVVLNVNPAGSEGLIEYAKVPNPPVPLTGLNAVAAKFCVSVLLAVSSVESNWAAPGATANVNVALPVRPPASVKVITYGVDCDATVGVPVITMSR